jgi:hypothetical protein
MTRHHLQPTEGVAFVSKQYKKEATLPKQGANSIRIPCAGADVRYVGFAEFLWKKQAAPAAGAPSSMGVKFLSSF